MKKSLIFLGKSAVVVANLILITYLFAGLEIFLSNLLRQPVSLAFFVVLSYIGVVWFWVTLFSDIKVNNKDDTWR